jgi:hypothetical protein
VLGMTHSWNVHFTYLDEDEGEEEEYEDEDEA